MLVINKKGAFVDGLKKSDITTQALQLDYKSPIRLKMEVGEDAAHVGGMTLFGAGFGNYIKVRIRYSPVMEALPEKSFPTEGSN